MNRRRAANVFLVFALAYLTVLVAASAMARIVAPFDPLAQDLGNRFVPPSPPHLLGTDDLGRDVFSRILFGSRAAILVGLLSVAIAASIGTLVGIVAGLSTPIVDQTLMLVMDGVLSFPTVLLAITVVSLLGYGLVQVMAAIGLVFSPVFARLVRAETLAIRAEPYFDAARCLGTSGIRLVVGHVLPNLAPRLIVQSTITFALSIVIESSLAYLGLGTRPPNPSWGLMLRDARNHLGLAPWLAVYPGLAIALTVLCINVVGDVLSERLNPRHQG